MEFKIEFREGAHRDLLQAYSSYEKQQKGLGDKFISEVESELLYLKKNPEAFPKKENGLRELAIRKFPYILIYILNGNHIAILAVFHSRLDPNKKPSA